MIKRVFSCTVIAAAAFTQIAEAAPKIVVSIKPVHSIVSALTKNVVTPELLMKGIQSPHSATLKPGQAETLQNADIVVWVGPGLEQFLIQPITTVATKARVIELSSLLEGEEKGHDHDSEHGHKDEHKDDHGDDHGDGHEDHGNIHIWLDPQSVLELVTPVTQQLIEADPDNAAVYEENSARLKKELITLDSTLSTKLEGIKNKPFLTYHDAYSPFVEHYGLSNTASIAVDDHRKPSAAHLKKLQSITLKQNITCLFTEPQFNTAWLKSVWPESALKYAELDPLGSSIDAGPDQYGQLMHNLADSLSNCLTSK